MTGNKKESELRGFAQESGLDVLETSASVEELPEHDSFALALGFDSEEFVLLKSAKEGRAWEIPGGKVEGEESFVEAARREFREETGQEFEYPEPVAVIVETYESEEEKKCHESKGEKKVVGLAFRGEVGEKVREPESDTAEVEFFEELPENLTYITFTRETFERLVEISR